eukprot:jgi/Tetstr1/441205/TSEL_029461.t1
MGCISDQLLEFLPRLTGLTALNLSDSPHVSGAMTEPLSLAALRPLTGVTMLGLSNTYVADDELTALSGISWIPRSAAAWWTDQDLVALQPLTRLTGLNLSESQ